MIVVRVTPRADRHAIAGYGGDTLLVRVSAPPVEGAANGAVLDLLARSLRVPRRDVRLLAGSHGRQKRVSVRGASAAVLNDRLTRLLNPESGTGTLCPAPGRSCSPISSFIPRSKS